MKSVCDRYNRALDSLLQLVCSFEFDAKLPITTTSNAISFVFSALTLLVGWQEEHPACKKLSDGCWCGYLSGAKYKWFAYGPADAIATPSSLALLKSRMVLPFSCQLTQVVLEKRPLTVVMVVVVLCIAH